MKQIYWKKLFKKHGSKLVALLSVGGVGLTAYTSWHAALKYNEIKDEYDGWEKAKVLAPPIISGAATAGLITVNELYHNQKMNRVLGAMATVMATKSLEKRMADNLDNNTDCYLGDFYDNILFFEDYFGQYFERTPKEVMEAEHKLNEKLHIQGYATLNDFYKLLKLDKTELGDIVGWNLNYLKHRFGTREIEFMHRIWKIDDGPNDEIECNAIIMITDPTPLWQDDGIFV